jgi:hypothetical protein
LAPYGELPNSCETALIFRGLQRRPAAYGGFRLTLNSAGDVYDPNGNAGKTRRLADRTPRRDDGSKRKFLCSRGGFVIEGMAAMAEFLIPLLYTTVGTWVGQLGTSLHPDCALDDWLRKRWLCGCSRRGLGTTQILSPVQDVPGLCANAVGAAFGWPAALRPNPPQLPAQSHQFASAAFARCRLA